MRGIPWCVCHVATRGTVLGGWHCVGRHECACAAAGKAAAAGQSAICRLSCCRVLVEMLLWHHAGSGLADGLRIPSMLCASPFQLRARQVYEDHVVLEHTSMRVKVVLVLVGASGVHGVAHAPHHHTTQRAHCHCCQCTSVVECRHGGPAVWPRPVILANLFYTLHIPSKPSVNCWTVCPSGQRSDIRIGV